MRRIDRLPTLQKLNPDIGWTAGTGARFEKEKKKTDRDCTLLSSRGEHHLGSICICFCCCLTRVVCDGRMSDRRIDQTDDVSN